MATAAPPSTSLLAQELVELCRQGRNLDAVEKFYDRNVESIEPVADENMPAEIKGIDAVRSKNQWWLDNNEVHSAEVNGPFVGEDQFAVQYTFDVTSKPTGQRVQGTEMALYRVRDGKIVREQFFYHMPEE